MYRSLLCAALLGAVGAHAETLSYWIAPGPDAQLAEWALAAWQHASGGELKLQPSARREDARIRIVWASPEQGLYGEAIPVIVNGRRGSEVYIRPAPMDAGKDVLLRDAITYLTCLHESGHALGLAHTARFEDIMYSFQFGGDIREYFLRYRRKLHSRDDIRNNPVLSAGDRAQLMLVLRE